MKAIAATALAGLALATAPALATPGAPTQDRAGRVHRYYAGAFDGLPQSHIVIDRSGAKSIDHLNYVVRMKCRGPNTRLVSSFEDLKGNPFDARDSLGGFRGAEWVKGSVGPAGADGSLRAHLRGVKNDPRARRCDTGRVSWSAKRVTHHKYKRILRKKLGGIIR